jgi:hypothetical protein
MAERRRNWVSIGFIAIWIVFWTAAIGIALYIFGGAVLAGEWPVGLILLVWLGAAGFGLVRALRRLFELLLMQKLRPEREVPENRRHEWRDDMPGGPGR